MLQGTNPLTGTAQGMAYFSSYGNYVRVITSGSSGTGTGAVRGYGAKGASATAGSGGGLGPPVNLQILTPQMFGCASDGIQDDTACLTAMWAAASRQDVLFPPGTYKAMGANFLIDAASVYAQGATMLGWTIGTRTATGPILWTGGTFSQGSDTNGGAAMLIGHNSLKLTGVSFVYPHWYTAIQIGGAAGAPCVDDVVITGLRTTPTNQSHITITCGSNIRISDWQLDGAGIEDGLALMGLSGPTHDVVIANVTATSTYDILKITNNVYPVTNVTLDNWTCTTCISPVYLQGVLYAAVTHDGTVAASSANFSSATGLFNQQMVGAPITVSGAGVAGALLSTTIASVTDGQHLVLTATASTSVTTATYSVASPISNISASAGVVSDPLGSSMSHAIYIATSGGSVMSNLAFSTIHAIGRFANSSGSWVGFLGQTGGLISGLRLSNNEFIDIYAGAANDATHPGYPPASFFFGTADTAWSGFRLEDNVVTGVALSCILTTDIHFVSADDLVVARNRFSSCRMIDTTVAAHYTAAAVRWENNKTILAASQPELVQAAISPASENLDLQSPTAASVPLTLRGVPVGVQTGNLIEMYTGAGALIAVLGPDGSYAGPGQYHGQNLLTWSVDPTNAAWTTGNGTIGAQVADPYGYMLAFTVHPTTNNIEVSHPFTAVAVQPYTFSVWLRCLSGTATIKLYQFAGAFANTTVTMTTSWQRFTLTYTTTGTAEAVSVGGGSSLSVVADFQMYGPQVVPGASALGYTSTGAVAFQ
jgi:hypothetical protein